MKRYHIIKPEFYDQFSCKGSDCRYTCCQGWNITLSKDEYRRIKGKTDKWLKKESPGYFYKLPPKDRKSNVESIIALNEQSECPFLAQNRLCQLQCQFGADILPATCIRFPRANHMDLDDTLQSLSPGCERVLELCFQKRRIRLTEEDRLSDELPCCFRITKNMTSLYPTLQYYKEILSMCLLIMQAEDTILENRILLLGIALRHIEDLGKQGRSSEIPGYISQYIHLLNTAGDIEELLPKIEMNPLILLHNLNIARQSRDGADRMNDNMLAGIHKALHLKITQDQREGQIFFSSERYLLLKEKYKNFLAGREHFMENLMVTFILYMNLPFCLNISTSIWDNFMYLSWTYSIVKLCLTACMEDIHNEQDFIYYCSILMRRWAHSHTFAQKLIKNFQQNKSDTLAHIATLLFS